MPTVTCTAFGRRNTRIYVLIGCLLICEARREKTTAGFLRDNITEWIDSMGYTKNIKNKGAVSDGYFEYE